MNLNWEIGNVNVAYDYYPFGLAWENPKLPDTEEGLHDHTYQDKEYQFAEFTDGRGLELHDFHARMYDATTGRWLVPDPAAQFANPYLAMANSPMISIDPDGRVVVTAIVAGALIGATMGGIQASYQGQAGDDVLRAIGIGALTGAISGLTGAYPIFGTGFGFLQGFAAGMVNGVATGALTGGVSAALNGQNIGDGIINGGLIGGITGGVSGGIHGIKAVNTLNKIEGCNDASYYRKWDGALIHKEVINGVPVVGQRGAMNCIPACLEAIDKSYGGSLSQEEIRMWESLGGDPDRMPLNALEVYQQYYYKTGRFVNQIEKGEFVMDKVLDSARKGARITFSLDVSNTDINHHVALNKFVMKDLIKQNGRRSLSNTFYLMNPSNGGFIVPQSWDEIQNNAIFIYTIQSP